MYKKSIMLNIVFQSICCRFVNALVETNNNKLVYKIKKSYRHFISFFIPWDGYIA